MTAKVTLHQVGFTEIREVRGARLQRKELKLRKYDVYLDGCRVGRVDSYIAHNDLTPNARTRSDGVAHVVWYNAAGKARGATSRRADAILDVLMNVELQRGVEYRAARTEMEPLAAAARPGRPAAALKA